MVVKKIRVPRSERAKQKVPEAKVPAGKQIGPWPNVLGKEELEQQNEPLVFRLEPQPNKARQNSRKEESPKMRPTVSKWSSPKPPSRESVQESPSSAKRVKAEEFERNTLNRMQKMEELRQAKILAMREHKLEQEEQSIKLHTSYQSPRGVYRSSEVSGRRPLLERLDDYVQERQHFIEDERRKRRLEMEARDLEECTFSPKTNVSKTGSTRCVEDRLRWKVDSQRRRVSVGIMEGLAQAELANQNPRLGKLSKEKKQEAINDLVNRLYQNAIEMSVKRDLEFRRNLMKPVVRSNRGSICSQRDPSSRRQSVRSVRVASPTQSKANPKPAAKPKEHTPTSALTKKQQALAPKPAKPPTQPNRTSHSASARKPKPQSHQKPTVKPPSPPKKAQTPKQTTKSRDPSKPKPKPTQQEIAAPQTGTQKQPKTTTQLRDESTSESKTVKKPSVPVLVFESRVTRDKTGALIPVAVGERVVSVTEGREHHNVREVDFLPSMFHPQSVEYLEGLSSSDAADTRIEPTKQQQKTLRYQPVTIREEEEEKDGKTHVSEMNVNCIVGEDTLGRRGRSGRGSGVEAARESEGMDMKGSGDYHVSLPLLDNNRSSKLLSYRSGDGLRAKPDEKPKGTRASASFLKKAAPIPSIQKKIDHLFHNKPGSTSQHSISQSAISRDSRRELHPKSPLDCSKEELSQGPIQNNLDSMVDLHPEEANDSPRGQIVVTKAHLKTLY